MDRKIKKKILGKLKEAEGIILPLLDEDDEVIDRHVKFQLAQLVDSIKKRHWNIDCFR